MNNNLYIFLAMISAAIGMISSIVAFLIVGNNFILLAIILSMISLLLLKNKVSKKEVDKI